MNKISSLDKFKFSDKLSINMLSKVTIFVLIGFLIVGLAAGNVIRNDNLQDISNENAVTGAEKCSQVKGINNAVTCFAMSTLKKFEDISSQENIQILPGVVLESDRPDELQKSRKQRTMELPASAEQKLSKLVDMMLDIMTNIFTGRTLKVKLSENDTNSIMRSFEEGRGKMKKLAGPLMMALGAKLIAVVPILLGGLALFAAKALIISKIAIVLALIVAVPTLFSGGGNLFSKFGQGGGGSWSNGGNYGGNYNPGPGYAYGAPGWNTATSQNYPYARSIDDAQDLAYSAQKDM